MDDEEGVHEPVAVGVALAEVDGAIRGDRCVAHEREVVGLLILIAVLGAHVSGVRPGHAQPRAHLSGDVELAAGLILVVVAHRAGAERIAVLEEHALERGRAVQCSLCGVVGEVDEEHGQECGTR